MADETQPIDPVTDEVEARHAAFNQRYAGDTKARLAQLAAADSEEDDTVDVQDDDTDDLDLSDTDEDEPADGTPTAKTAATPTPAVEELAAIRAERDALKAQVDAWGPLHQEMERDGIRSYAEMQAELERRKEAEAERQAEREQAAWITSEEKRLAALKAELDTKVENADISRQDADRFYNTELQLAKMNLTVREGEQIRARQERQYEATQQLLTVNAVQGAMQSYFGGERDPEIESLLAQYSPEDVPEVAARLAKSVTRMAEAKVAKTLGKKEQQRKAATPEGAQSRTERGGVTRRMDGEGGFLRPRSWAEADAMEDAQHKNSL